MDITPGRFLLEGALMTALMAIAVLAVVGSAVLAVLALLAGPLVVWTRLRRTVAKQRRQFAEQLADSIQVVASAMRTGNSFAGAIAQLVENAPEPTASEFRRVIADERLGVPIEQALGTIVERMQNRDLQQVTLVSVIQRETGGNGAEALDRVVGNIRAKDDIRRLVRVLTSQGRLAQAVLTALPVLTLIVLRVIGGSTMDPLFDTGIGRALLGVALLLVICGGLWIGRIVKVRV
jgi:tight adherence protein B